MTWLFLRWWGPTCPARSPSCDVFASRLASSVSVDGHAMFVDLDIDAALAFLIVQIASPDSANRENPDQDEQRGPVH